MSAEDAITYDVAIVGAGPAGLSCAIRLKQQQPDRRVCILEKGAQVGAHILSGAVLEPSVLNQLLPHWQELNPPQHTPVKQEQFQLLTAKHVLPLPVPSAMHNKGNFIISLGAWCQWLATQAEALGVDIFPGFAAKAVVFDDQNRVIGIKTGDMGVTKDGEQSTRYQPGIVIKATHSVLAEGCRGSLSEQVIDHFKLRANTQHQSYALGIKEVWRITDKHHQLGKVWHGVGWPLPTHDHTYGGSFMYHLPDSLMAIGLVVGLDYRNPHLDPHRSMQQLKTHPHIAPLFEGAERISYGARSLNEGGFQSIPQLHFPGGLLVGCSAGFVNITKIKGIHNAMHSGMLAADTLASSASDLSHYQDAVHASSICEELKAVRNIRPGFARFGVWGGLAHAAIDNYLLRGRAPWTWAHRCADHEATQPAKNCSPITYPKADNTLVFDKPSSLHLSNTNHEEDQPCHLQVKDTVDACLNHCCPARVYELDAEGQLLMHPSNCLHCKACDIKDHCHVTWTPPQGGEGPNYQEM